MEKEYLNIYLKRVVDMFCDTHEYEAADGVNVEITVHPLVFNILFQDTEFTVEKVKFGDKKIIMNFGIFDHVAVHEYEIKLVRWEMNSSIDKGDTTLTENELKRKVADGVLGKGIITASSGELNLESIKGALKKLNDKEL